MLGQLMRLLGGSASSKLFAPGPRASQSAAVSNDRGRGSRQAHALVDNAGRHALDVGHSKGCFLSAQEEAEQAGCGTVVI